ncbi:MAG: flagellar basal body rod C-terminal domain-containing protein [Candidatus Latescibacteria bacterium]|nr:flagellar basal body rod C-terminal domain-containing protein [Candidatus Latescibacterota bacterium]
MHEISQSGLTAAQTRHQVSAHNTANVNTDKFNKQRVTQQDRTTGGTRARVDTVELSEKAQQAAEELNEEQNNVNLVDEAVDLITSKHNFKNNAQTVRTKDQMDQTLLDTLG